VDILHGMLRAPSAAVTDAQGVVYDTALRGVGEVEAAELARPGEAA
jgi:hypothetical protein